MVCSRVQSVTMWKVAVGALVLLHVVIATTKSKSPTLLFPSNQ